MATFTEISSDGVTNGTGYVTLVAAPGASTRRLVKYISVENTDTGAVTLTLYLNNNGTRRVLYTVTLAVGDRLIYDDLVALDATTKLVDCKLAAAKTTVDCDFVSTFADVT